MGEVLFAGKEAEEGSALLGGVVADGSAEHGVGGFDGVEDGALGCGSFDLNAHLALDTGQSTKVRGEEDPDGHAMV